MLGAQIFAYARLAHAVIYLLGLPWLRAVAWAAGIVGIGMMLAGVMGWA